MGNMILSIIYSFSLNRTISTSNLIHPKSLDKYCAFCKNHIESYFLREHINHRDIFLCSPLCYKLYRQDLNKKKI